MRRKTVAELCDRLELQHLPRLRPATQKFYRLAIKNHIKPALGEIFVEDVTRTNIQALHDRLTAKGQRHQANQCATLCGVLFRYAIEWKWRTLGNPASGIEKHNLEGRDRYLTSYETKRLSAALNALEDQQAAAIFKLLLLTGARVGETLRMTWDQIDFGRGVWTKPASTTKQKKIHRLPLTAPALAILTAVRIEQERSHVRRTEQANIDGGPKSAPSPFVFSGKGRMGHRTDLRLQWLTALKGADIKSLRVHDLRHSLASTLVGAGYSLPMIGAALGHSRVETTARYAHLADDPLRQAMTKASDLIEAASRGDVAEPNSLREYTK